MIMFALYMLQAVAAIAIGAAFYHESHVLGWVLIPQGIVIAMIAVAHELGDLHLAKLRRRVAAAMDRADRVAALRPPGLRR